jgi:antitoxin (DNA-binding transcriptional repressor) of toxin-antitoxin stability system
MMEITMHKAKTSLSQLVAKVEAGEEVVLFRGKEPVAMLVPFRKKAGRRPKVGEITSAPVRLKPGCFAPLTEKEMAEWGMG